MSQVLTDEKPGDVPSDVALQVKGVESLKIHFPVFKRKG